MPSAGHDAVTLAFILAGVAASYFIARTIFVKKIIAIFQLCRVSLPAAREVMVMALQCAPDSNEGTWHTVGLPAIATQ